MLKQQALQLVLLKRRVQLCEVLYTHALSKYLLLKISRLVAFCVSAQFVQICQPLKNDHQVTDEVVYVLVDNPDALHARRSR